MILKPCAHSRKLNLKIVDSTKRLSDADKTIKARKNRATQWTEMQNKGLRRRDASDAESQMLNSIRDWAQESGMSLVSANPETYITPTSVIA